MIGHALGLRCTVTHAAAFGNLRALRRLLLMGLGLVILLGLNGCSTTGTHFSRWDKTEPPKASSMPRPAPGATMRVRSGDTLYSIAMAHNLDWQELARWNGIRDPRDLRVGQVLKLSDPLHPASPRVAAPKTAQAGSERPPASARPAPARVSPLSSVSAGSVSWQWPVAGTVVSRFIDDSKTQPGLIIRGTLGSPVRASAAGEVVYAGDGLPGYGNLLIIKHNASWLSAYGYNQSLQVKEGAEVSAGQIIATMGRRDSRSTDPHGSLLFQIRHNGEPVDPLPLLPSQP